MTAPEAVNFMPSEVSRLVLGYLHTKKYFKSYKMFLQECSHLSEYLSLKRRGLTPPLTIYGLSLEQLLDDYANLKAAERQQYSVTTESLWKQLDMVISSLKDKTSTRQLRMHGDLQSVRMRRLLVDKRRRLTIRNQIRNSQLAQQEKHVSPDSNSKSPLPSDLPTQLVGTPQSEEEVVDTEVNFSVSGAHTDSEGLEDVTESVQVPTTSDVVSSSEYTEIREQGAKTPSESVRLDALQTCSDSGVPDAVGNADSETDRLQIVSDEPHRQSPDGVQEEAGNQEGKGTSEKKSITASKSSGRRRRGRRKNMPVDSENKRVTRSAKKNLKFTCTESSSQGSSSQSSEMNMEEGSMVSPKNSKTQEEYVCDGLVSLNCDRTNCDKGSPSSVNHSLSAVGVQSESRPIPVEKSNVEPSIPERNTGGIDVNRNLMTEKNCHSQEKESCDRVIDQSDVCMDSVKDDGRERRNDDIAESVAIGKEGREKEVRETHLSEVLTSEQHEDAHSKRRKRPPRKKLGSGKLGDRKVLHSHHSENSNNTEDGSRISSVYESGVPTFYEQILNNPRLHEKLAENINKQLLNNSLNRSKEPPSHNASVEEGAGPSTSTINMVLANASDVAKSLKDASEVFTSRSRQGPDKQMSNSLNTDLNDILDLHETRMSEGTIAGILDMTKADPLFESLFNLFTPYTAEAESNTPQKTDFSGITLEMGKDATTNDSKNAGRTDRTRHNTNTTNLSMPSFTDCPEPSHTSSEENLIMEILKSPQVDTALRSLSDVEMTSPAKALTSGVTMTAVHNHLTSSVTSTTTSVISSLASSCVTSLPISTSVYTDLVTSSQSWTSNVAGPSHMSVTCVGSPIVQSPRVRELDYMSPGQSAIMSVASPASQSHQIGQVGCMSQSCRSPLTVSTHVRMEDQVIPNISVSQSESTRDDHNMLLGGNVSVPIMEAGPFSGNSVHDKPSSSVHTPSILPVYDLQQQENRGPLSDQNMETDSESQGETQRYETTVTHSQGLNILSVRELEPKKSKKNCRRKSSKFVSQPNSSLQNGEGQRSISYNSFIDGVQDTDNNSSTPVNTRVVSMTTSTSKDTSPAASTATTMSKKTAVSPQEQITNEMINFVSKIESGLNPKSKGKTVRGLAKKGRKRNEDKKPKPKVLPDEWSTDLAALIKIASPDKIGEQGNKTTPKSASKINTTKSAEKSITPKSTSKNTTPKSAQHMKRKNTGSSSESKSGGGSSLQPNLSELSYLGYETDFRRQGHNEEGADKTLPKIELFPRKKNESSSDTNKCNSSGGMMDFSLSNSSEKMKVQKSDKTSESVLSHSPHGIVKDVRKRPESEDSDDRESYEKSDQTSKTSMISSIRSSLMSKLLKSSSFSEHASTSWNGQKTLSPKSPKKAVTKHVHFSAEKPRADEHSNDIINSASDSENGILSMPTLDSLISKETGNQHGTLPIHTTQQGSNLPLNDMPVQQQVSDQLAEASCTTEKCTTPERDYSKIMYSMNQDFLELGSPGNTMDCDDSVASTVVLPDSFLTSQVHASGGATAASNVIDVHQSNPESLTSQTALYNTNTNNAFNSHSSGTFGQNTSLSQVIPPQIIVLPAQQPVGGVQSLAQPIDTNFRLASVVPSISANDNFPSSVFQTQTISSHTVQPTSSQSNGLMTDECRQALSQLNAQAKGAGNKLIAIPVGVSQQISSKNYHVRTLNFGPEASQGSESSQKVRQVGYGRGRKKPEGERATRARSRSNNKAREGKQSKKQSVKKVQNEADFSEAEKEDETTLKEKTTKLKKRTAKEGKGKSNNQETVERTKGHEMKAEGSGAAPDDEDFIPDKSGSVYIPVVGRMLPEEKLRSSRKILKSRAKAGDLSLASRISSPSVCRTLCQENVEINSDQSCTSDNGSLGENTSGKRKLVAKIYQKDGNITVPAESNAETFKHAVSASDAVIMAGNEVGNMDGNTEDSDVDIDGEWECTLTKTRSGVPINATVTEHQRSSQKCATLDSQKGDISQKADFSQNADNLQTADISQSGGMESHTLDDSAKTLSGNNSLLSIMCNYGDNSEDSNDSFDEDTVTKESGSRSNSKDTQRQNGASLVRVSDQKPDSYLGSNSSIFRAKVPDSFNFASNAKLTQEEQHSSKVVQSKRETSVGIHRNPSHTGKGSVIESTVTAGTSREPDSQVSSPGGSLTKNYFGPGSVESVSSSVCSSPLSACSVQSPKTNSNLHSNPQRSTFNIMMTPPKKRITATLKNGEGYYFVSSASAFKGNPAPQSTITQPKSVSPVRRECDSSLSAMPRSPKTPKGKRTPRKSDSVRRSPRWTDSPAKSTRSQKATPIKDSSSVQTGVKRPREESTETEEKKSKKLKFKKTIDLKKVNLDKFLNKIHDK